MQNVYEKAFQTTLFRRIEKVLRRESFVMGPQSAPNRTGLIMLGSWSRAAVGNCIGLRAAP